MDRWRPAVEEMSLAFEEIPVAARHHVVSLICLFEDVDPQPVAGSAV